MTQKSRIQLQNKEELEEVFEKTLRPLQSRNARHIYLVLRDSTTKYLTTYDIQPILEEQGNKLSKVELNNWLNALQNSGLVQKAPKRGKPTTRPYNKRYTYDLWKLSTKGRKTAQLLSVFSDNTPIQISEKVVEKPILPNLADARFEDYEIIQNLSIHLGLLKSLSNKDPMDILSISNDIGYTTEKIIQFIISEKSKPSTLYLMSEAPINLRGKILKKIGLNQRKNYFLSLSSEGKKMLSDLSP
jgi:hypothetical protein